MERISHTICVRKHREHKGAPDTGRAAGLFASVELPHNQAFQAASGRGRQPGNVLFTAGASSDRGRGDHDRIWQVHKDAQAAGDEDGKPPCGAEFCGTDL